MSISQLATNILTTLSPEMYLITGAILFFLAIIIPVILLLKQKTFSNTYGLVAYAVLVIFTAVHFRLPFFPLAELNMDESLEIASAATLLHDPVYWRSVDLGTHGPLTTYPLILSMLFGIQIDYGSARLIGLAMFLASALLIFLMFRKSITNTIAVIAVLPIITFICLTDFWDFIAYNGEHPVIFIIVLSLYFTDRVLRAEERLLPRYLYVTGVIVGSAPFVKIQCLPILFIIAASAYAIIWLKNESAATRLKLSCIYSLGCLTFVSMLFIYLWYFNLYNDFVVRFLYGQINYAKDTLSIMEKIGIFYDTFNYVNLVSWYYFKILLFTAIILAALLIISRSKYPPLLSRDNAQQAVIPTIDMAQLAVFILITAMSMVAVYIPGRPYRHYYLLLAFPLGILTGKLFILTYKVIDKKVIRNICAVLFVVVTAFGQYYYKYFLSNYRKHILNGEITYELLTFNSIKPDPYKDLSDKAITDTIQAYSYPGEKMAVWGWASKYYVGSKLIIACKTSGEQVVNNDYGNNAYYLKSFLHEIESAKAPIFLDAVAPNQFKLHNRAKHGFEQFPQLNKFIQDNYTLVTEINGIRIFVSKKRFSEIAAKAFKGF